MCSGAVPDFAGGQLHRADERIELAKTASRQVLAAGLAAGRLVRRLVAVAAVIDQRSVLIKYRDRRVGARDAVGIINVENRRERAVAAAVKRYEVGIQVELIPVHVVEVGDLAADGN